MIRWRRLHANYVSQNNVENLPFWRHREKACIADDHGRSLNEVTLEFVENRMMNAGVHITGWIFDCCECSIIGKSERFHIEEHHRNSLQFGAERQNLRNSGKRHIRFLKRAQGYSNIFSKFSPGTLLKV